MERTTHFLPTLLTFAISTEFFQTRQIMFLQHTPNNYSPARELAIGDSTNIIICGRAIGENAGVWISGPGLETVHITDGSADNPIWNIDNDLLFFVGPPSTGQHSIVIIPMPLQLPP